MKKWNTQTPVMSSAALMKVYRQQLWDELKDHPEWPVSQVDKYKKLIADLNKQIGKRSYDPDKVLQLIHEFEYQRRIYKRVAKKMNLSVRAAKFTMKQIRKNGKRQVRKQIATQGRIFE